MKHWYLMDDKPNYLSGFEDDPHVNYKQNAFEDSLMTDVATTVILYNYDLTESKKIRCIIQGNTSDTQLKSMERIGLFVIGTVKAGMYVFFENRYWLITGYPGNNGIYEKAVLQLCQYKLRWQNSLGQILERWCNATSASKYDMGETGNNTIIITSDNLTLLLPDDDESLDLDGKRVFIDKRKIKPTKVYKLTRTDGVLYDYGEEHGGILSFIADKTELNLEVDNQELRICDYVDMEKTMQIPTVEEIEKPTDLSAIISGNKNLKFGYTRAYTVEFMDYLGEIVNDINFNWNITSDFEIQSVINGNRIELSVIDENCIGSSFLLSVIVGTTTLARIKINIVEGF